MSDVVISPNMSLPVPIVGVDPGPDWANNINACLGILDQHNHSPGQGVQITPTGININSDLPINSNNLTTVKTVNFTNLGSTLPGTSPNLGCVYVAGGELVYNDEAGNVVPITLNGSVNAGAGSITGLPSGTASASYSGVAQTFIWQSATNTPANMDMASITLRPLSVSPNGITINAPPGLSSNYSLTFPSALPATTSAINVDPSGTIFFTPGGSVPTGVFFPFGGTVAPSGYLLCDGSDISRTTFANLFAVIGTAYGIGNGTTTFNLPPPGVFVRNVDTVGTYDPDFASRTAINGGNTGGNVGSYQANQNLAHTHFLPGGNNGAIGGTLTIPANTPIASNNFTASSGGNQANPNNVYANYIIKT